MQSSSGNNWSLEKYNPFPGIMPNAPSSNEYKGGFLNKLMLKDLGLAAQISKNSDAETPMGDKARELYEELSELGLGELDFSSIQKKYNN
jgi:3-hydroxyisobutyrate dehydrogenase-like beta-hydroxyacid dehydrogenase